MNKRTILKFLLIIIILSLATYYFRNDQRIWNILTAIGTVIVAISVIFLYIQLNLSKRISASDFAMRLDDIFNSREMKKLRKKIVTFDYSKPEKTPEEARDCLEILDFFEEMAHLERKRVIDLDTIDNLWGYWFERYWVLCKGYVDYYRSCSDEGGEYFLTEKLFEKLVLHSHEKMKKEKDKLARRKPHPQTEAFFKKIKEKQLEEFKKDESSLDCD